jgi:chromate transporter
VNRQPRPLREVAAVFLKLGIIGFGGPAAHIALMRDEVVRQRRWVSDEEFVDLLGMTNLIPGPNSTEMAIHLGARRAGTAGLIVGGMCFIVPATMLVLACAWAYVTYGTRPEVAGLLYGIQPVVIAVVVQAMWNLGRTTVKGPLAAAVAVAVVLGYFVGVHELVLLFGGGAVVALVRYGQGRTALSVSALMSVLGGSAAAAPLTAPATGALTTLFLTFLKIGAVLYGSGYVLLAFLRNDFVRRLGWLTDRQLLDAVSIGQFTPGPVFTTATFIGYLIAGWAGALLATVAIFLPSFVFVALSRPLVPRLRAWRGTAAALDGVNVAALALMAGVTVTLARAAIVDALTAGLAVAAALLLVRVRINSAWLILAGGGLGLIVHLLAR